MQVISSREIDEIYFADTQNKCLSDGVGSSLVEEFISEELVPRI